MSITVWFFNIIIFFRCFLVNTYSNENNVFDWFKFLSTNAFFIIWKKIKTSLKRKTNLNEQKKNIRNKIYAIQFVNLSYRLNYQMKWLNPSFKLTDIEQYYKFWFIYLPLKVNFKSDGRFRANQLKIITISHSQHSLDFKQT